MSQEAILLPALALGFWTFCVLLLIPIKRSQARRRGVVTIDDFALGESAAVPPDVSIVNRNYMNLLEMPILFYVACLMIYVTESVSTMSLIMCWAYFAARIVHSLVHLGYNNVAHRRGIFAISNVVLLTIWVLLTVGIPGE